MFTSSRSPSLESIASSSPAQPTETPVLSPTKLEEMPSDASSLSETMDGNMCTSPLDRNLKRGRYYLPAENVVFLVENELYSVHRYFFQHHSSHFATIFSENQGQGITDDNAIPLEGVTIAAFDLFLSILYPPEFGKYTAKTVAEWTAILDLATKWMFESIRALAINQLTLIASPIDRIIFGRKYEIPEWLSDAYLAVCSRLDPLTEEEGTRLGIRDTVKISAIRQAYGTSEPRFASTLLPGDLDKIFGLGAEADTPNAAVASEGECPPEMLPVGSECTTRFNKEGLETKQSEVDDSFKFDFSSTGRYSKFEGLDWAELYTGKSVEVEAAKIGLWFDGENVQKEVHVPAPLTKAEKKLQLAVQKRREAEMAKEAKKRQEVKEAKEAKEAAEAAETEERQRVEREQMERVAFFS